MGSTNRGWGRIRLGHLLTGGVLVAVTLIILLPLVWMVSFSLRTNADLVASNSLIPPRVTLENYVDMWSLAPFGTFFRNSLLVSVGSVLLSVALAAPAGYALSRFAFRGRDGVSGGLVFLQTLPLVILIVPMYLLARELGLYNSLPGLAIIYTGLNLSFATLMMRGFFDQLPEVLEEAALVDGASRVRAFLDIALPLVRPGGLAVGTFAFIASWEEFILALTLTNRLDVRTLPIGFTYFFQQYETNYTGLMAASVVSTLPVLILFIGVGRYFVRGIASGGVKA